MSRKELESLSGVLGLMVEYQDWGIINADWRRLGEFIRFWRESPLDATVRFYVEELIYASANDRLEAGLGADDAELELFRSFVLSGDPDSLNLSYWRSLGGDFPLGAWLRALVPSGQAQGQD